MATMIDDSRMQYLERESAREAEKEYYITKNMKDKKNL